jgi:hypothetical protein
MTAGVLESERERSRESGITDFIPKPIEVDEMLAVLRRHLPQPAAPIAPTPAPAPVRHRHRPWHRHHWPPGRPAGRHGCGRHQRCRRPRFCDAGSAAQAGVLADADRRGRHLQYGWPDARDGQGRQGSRRHVQDGARRHRQRPRTADQAHLACRKGGCATLPAIPQPARRVGVLGAGA